jgi:hypothetical protein
MRHENNKNYEYVYDKVLEVFDVKKVKIVMVDKDLENLDILRERLPHSELLLCTFHSNMAKNWKKECFQFFFD